MEGQIRILTQTELWDKRGKNKNNKLRSVMCSDFTDYQAIDADKTQRYIIDLILNDSSFNHSLELGSGYGRLTELFSKFSRKLIAGDISSAMLNNMRTNGFKELVQLDTVSLPFKDNKFDFVSIVSLLGHIHSDLEISTLFSEINRITKSKALILIDEMEGVSGTKVGGGHYKIRSSEKIQETLQNNWDTQLGISYMFGTQEHTVNLFRKIR